jgi:hypothetical protein
VQNPRIYEELLQISEKNAVDGGGGKSLRKHFMARYSGHACNPSTEAEAVGS